MIVKKTLLMASLYSSNADKDMHRGVTAWICAAVNLSLTKSMYMEGDLFQEEYQFYLTTSPLVILRKESINIPKENFIMFLEIT